MHRLLPNEKGWKAEGFAVGFAVDGEDGEEEGGEDEAGSQRDGRKEVGLE